jgi:hypothetical protein
LRSLFVITYRARPRPDSAEYAESGGAYVNAFIDAFSEADAHTAAQASIADAGWIVEELDEVSFVDRTDYADDDPDLEYFEQALIDGEVLVFHTWPNEPQDEDIVH